MIHSTRSGVFRPEDEYSKVVQYFLQPKSPSAHRVIGTLPGQHALMVADDDIAWHAKEHNQSWLGIEFSQPTINDEYTDWQYQEGARVVREWAQKYGFPLDREHILGHDEMPQGIREGKSDPGPKWDWDKFMRYVSGGDVWIL